MLLRAVPGRLLPQLPYSLRQRYPASYAYIPVTFHRVCAPTPAPSQVPPLPRRWRHRCPECSAELLQFCKTTEQAESVFYSVVSPVLDTPVYSLRNDEVKAAYRRDAFG